MRRLLFQDPAVRSCPTWEQGPGFPTLKARLEKPGRGRSQRQQDAADWASRTTGVSPSQFRRWEVHVQGACGSVSGDALFLTRRRPPSSCALAWQRASSGLPVTGAPPSGPHLAPLTPKGPSAHTIARGSGFSVRTCRSASVATSVPEAVFCIQREWHFTGYWSLVVPQRG